MANYLFYATKRIILAGFTTAFQEAAMNLLLRLMWILLFSRFRKACDIVGPCLTPFRVMPTDLDIFRHMTNARYFSLLDLARMDMLIRSGLAAKFRKQGWFPIVTTESMTFKKSLLLFQRFAIKSQVIGWEEKSIYILQTFIRRGEITAQGIVKARFLKKSGGSVTPLEIFALHGVIPPNHQVPDGIMQWNNSCEPLCDTENPADKIKGLTNGNSISNQ